MIPVPCNLKITLAANRQALRVVLESQGMSVLQSFSAIALLAGSVPSRRIATHILT